jgi:hypothetical protein
VRCLRAAIGTMVRVAVRGRGMRIMRVLTLMRISAVAGARADTGGVSQMTLVENSYSAGRPDLVLQRAKHTTEGGSG